MPGGHQDPDGRPEGQLLRSVAGSAAARYHACMLKNLLQLVGYLIILGAIGSIPLMLWLGAVVFTTDRRTD